MSLGELQIDADYSTVPSSVAAGNSLELGLIKCTGAEQGAHRRKST